MSNPIPNHGPTQTLNGVAAVIVTPEECEALKAKFDVTVQTHKANTSGPTKANSRANQSHHILQNAQISKLVPRPDGLAIILNSAKGDTAHNAITKLQNARRDSKTSPSTFSGLVAAGGDDLANGFNGRLEDKDGNKATPEEAKKLAKCLVDEAEKQAQDSRRQQNKGPIKPGDTVDQVGSCLGLGTLVRLADGRCIPVERLQPGDRLWTPSGTARLVRVDLCRHDRIELDFGDAKLVVTTNHRLMAASGEWRRADHHKVGDCLRTLTGPRVIVGSRPLPPEVTYRLGSDHDTACAVGTTGVWSSLGDIGPVVIRSETIQPLHAFEGANACPS